MTNTTNHDAFFASFPNHELTELEARAVLSNYELAIEYDRDGNRVYATLLDFKGYPACYRDHVGKGQTFQLTTEIVDELLTLATLQEEGRWDGETATTLCPDYEGRSCTTGGAQVIYGFAPF